MIGSLNSIQATAEKLSIPQLQQAMRDGTLPPYIGVPLLQKKVQMQKQMQMASQTQQPKKSSIAEQVNQEATADEMMRQRARMMQAEMGQTGGISDFLPKGEESYAKGGPIAFAERGYVDPDYIEPEEYQDILKKRIFDQRARDLVAAERARPFPELSKKPEPAIQAPYAPGQAPVQPNISTPVAGSAVPVASGTQDKAPPVAGNVAPAMQTPYAQAVQAAPVEQAPAPQTTAEPIMPAAERAKLFKEALGEDVGRADTMKRLAEREAATAKQEERAPWLGLMQAGLATMAGTSPFAMANIGAGGVAGLNAYMKAQDKLDTAKENHDAILAQLNKAQRAEDVAAYKFGADSEQADKALAVREKLQDKELASREKMNREDNAVREKVAGMQVAGSIERAGLIHSGAGGIDNQSRADRLQNTRLNSMLNATKASIANMRSGAKANGTLDLLEKDPEYIALLNDLKSIQNTLKAKAIPNASSVTNGDGGTQVVPKQYDYSAADKLVGLGG